MSSAGPVDPNDFVPSVPEPNVHLPDAVKNLKTPFNAGGEMFADALESYVRGLEGQLDEDEVLVLENHQGSTSMRVFSVAFPSGRTLVLRGVDPDGNETHFFSHVSAVQLDIKIVPKEPDEERTKIGFHHLMDDNGDSTD